MTAELIRLPRDIGRVQEVLSLPDLQPDLDSRLISIVHCGPGVGWWYRDTRGRTRGIGNWGFVQDDPLPRFTGQAVLMFTVGRTEILDAAERREESDG